jgi:hypothetical protein
MSRRDLSVKGGTSERCYRTRRGRTDVQRYAIISPYVDGRIKMNGPYPEITNISFLAKLFFKTFISLKHLSDYRTVGLSHRRTIGLSDYRIIATAPFTVRLKTALAAWSSCIESSVILLHVILFFILSKCCKWLSLMKTTNLPTVTVSEKNH